MGLEQRLLLKQSLQLRMTPQLRLAIKILQLSRPELEVMIADELCQNPVLEEIMDAVPERVEQRTGDLEVSESESPDGVAVTNEREPESAQEVGQLDIDEYLDRHSADIHGSVGAGSDRDDNRDRLFENAKAREDTLADALVDQLGLLAMSDDERRIATMIANNLDDDGYLACTVEELAFLSGATIEQLEEAREIVQELEPPGCGSVDLRDCLLVQLRLIGYESDDYVVAVADRYLKELESQKYDKVAKELGTTAAEIVEAHRIIRSLDPRPGRGFGGAETRYITPDAYIVRIGDEFQVALNDEGIPALQVNSYYRSMIKGREAGGEATGYLQERVRAASWLIKSIEQRQRTLRKVVESIVRHQRDFLIQGVSALRPMVLKDVAGDIGMHESTISRATSGKYVHTPQGIYELKWFFTSSLHSSVGEDVSSESVRRKILDIVAKEDPRQPFSDQYICEQLARENIDIARRTVAKYREGLGILPSSKRKRMIALNDQNGFRRR
ncbi:MAG TPA: RNA polymerase factor sigma-54 [Candidatus Limnocylindrales bacterium]|nr:RNA polymerase factor sigma-54 [Candidatus Limnocylindrales bacterium]